MAEIIKKGNLDFKLDSEHLEQMSSVFKEIFAQFHKIKPIIMFHVNPFNTPNVSFTVKATNIIYEAS